MVTDAQVRQLRKHRMKGKTIEKAAARADMTPRTARKWLHGALPSATERVRNYRTRQDPFESVSEEIGSLLDADKHGELQAKSILDELNCRHQGAFDRGLLRTLQRRVRSWRAENGPPKDVVFEQTHPPGRDGHVDFTHCTELQVTIGGVLFAHLLFHLRLAFSGWSWVELAFGETYEALVSGIQGGFRALGGVTENTVTDNLSAATHELRRGSGRALNARFKDLLEHFDTTSRRINVRKSNENGIVEKGHDLLKVALRQALIIRGDRDFVSISAYMEFVQDVVDTALNGGRKEKLAEERQHLKPLPSTLFPTYTKFTPKVRCWSTIAVSGHTYSVPSRLRGHQLDVRQYPNTIEIRLGGKLLETFPRLRGNRTARIDYRHIIWSLARKPGAFARYRFREELFPTLRFRRAYDALVIWRGERADVEYVRILLLAASTMESEVDAALELLLEQGERFDYAVVKATIGGASPDVPTLDIGEPNYAVYDEMIGGER